MICPKCNGSGEVACSTRTGLYRYPGPVPDDARGVFAAVCYDCDARFGDEICPECGSRKNPNETMCELCKNELAELDREHDLAEKMGEDF